MGRTPRRSPRSPQPFLDPLASDSEPYSITRLAKRQVCMEWRPLLQRAPWLFGPNDRPPAFADVHLRTFHKEQRGRNAAN